jgi:hypothetical protein
VSSYCDYHSRFPTEGLDVIALLLFLASRSFFICLRHSQRYVNLSLTCARAHDSSSLQNYFQGSQIYAEFLQIVMVVQMFMLGPLLILDVREYYAKVVADCDAASGMTSFAFQERVHISTGSSV